MSNVLRVVLEGQHPSGKNQIKMSAPKAHFIMKFPQRSFEDWRGSAYSSLDRQRGAWAKLTVPAHVSVRYTKGDLLRRDVPGMMDALCHLLEWCPAHKKKRLCSKRCPLPFVADDALLEAWTWERPILDRARPRLEFTITPYEPDLAQGEKS